MLNSGKCPPQFVFEMMAAQMTRIFLEGDESADEIATDISAAFADQYDVEGLENDLVKATERLLAFIESVEISDVDFILLAYIWFQMNYEDLTTQRNKKPMFGGLLKGRPKQSDRVYLTAKNFKAFAFAIGNDKIQLMDEDWEPSSEKEFEPVVKILFQ